MDIDRFSSENPYQPPLGRDGQSISKSKVANFTWRNCLFNSGIGIGFGVGVLISICFYQISLDDGFSIGLLIFGSAALSIGFILGWMGWVVGYILDKVFIEKPESQREID